MSTPPEVTEHQLIEAIHHIPRERWPDVLGVLNIWQADPSTSEPGAIRTGTDLAKSDLVGIWSDRPDITNSQQFAVRLRNQFGSKDDE
jgi:hypothetical protein